MCTTTLYMNVVNVHIVLSFLRQQVRCTHGLNRQTLSADSHLWSGNCPLLGRRIASPYTELYVLATSGQPMF
jgi:hypothetical protein